MTTIDSLLEFLEAAERSRKYTPGVASNLRSVLRLIKQELNEEELTSLEVLKNHVQMIFNNVYQKKKGDFTANSLRTYAVRLGRLLRDYEAYGLDPQKMASWNPESRTRMIKSKKTNNGIENDIQPVEEVEQKQSGPGLNRIELFLRPETNTRAFILIPYDLTEGEALRLKSMIDASVVKK